MGGGEGGGEGVGDAREVSATSQREVADKGGTGEGVACTDGGGEGGTIGVKLRDAVVVGAIGPGNEGTTLHHQFSGHAPLAALVPGSLGPGVG